MDYETTVVQVSEGDKGPEGESGDDGPPGEVGPVGQGLVEGGAAGQILHKLSATDFDTAWIDAPTAENRAELSARSGTTPTYLAERGREGNFHFYTADDYLTSFERVLTADVIVDASRGVILPLDADPTGAAGAWVRMDKVIRPHHFGAVGDGITDDTAALQACFDWFFAVDRPGRILDINGKFGTSGKITFGPAAGSGPDYSVKGTLRLVALGAMLEMLRLRNLNEQHILGSFFVKGFTTSGGAGFAWTDRTCAFGIVLEGCGNMRISGGLRADDFTYQGVVGAIVNNDGASLGRITCRRCGSGNAPSTTTQALTTPFSDAVNTGASETVSQRTTLSVTTFPPAIIETFQPVTNQPVFLWIGGYPYRVMSWDKVAGTVSVFPWLDSTVGASGTADWIFGGGFVTQTSDGNCIVVDKLKAQNCGMGTSSESLYGSRINQYNASGCAIGISLAKVINPASVGETIDGYYPEGNFLDVVLAAQANTQNNYHYINSGYELDFAKIKNLGAVRKSDNTLTNYQSLLSSGSYSLLTLAYRGRILVGHWFNLAEVGGTIAYRGQASPPRTITRVGVNNITVNLQAVDTGDTNRLFGYTGGAIRFVGTGANAQPTGTITFTPPTGGTINGSAVNATATFNGFNGPADFQIDHTDAAQLTWTVRPIAGWITPIPVESSISTAYTLVLADRGKHKRFSSGTAKTVTVPPNSAVAFQIGDSIELEQSGGGLLTVAPGAGVTIRSRGGLLNAAGQYAALRLRQVTTDEWLLSGDRA